MPFRRSTVSAGAIAFDHAKYETVTDAAALNAWIEKIYVRGWVAFDTETTGLDEMRVGLVGVSLSVEPGRACYVPMAHVAGEGDLFGSAEWAEGQMDFAEALAILKPMLEDESIVKIGQNMKYDMKIMARNGVVLGPIEDTMLMSYALNGGVHRHWYGRVINALPRAYAYSYQGVDRHGKIGDYL